MTRSDLEAQRAERRAAPKPARIQGPRRGPLVAHGDRLAYSPAEGLQ